MNNIQQLMPVVAVCLGILSYFGVVILARIFDNLTPKKKKLKKELENSKSDEVIEEEKSPKTPSIIEKTKPQVCQVLPSPAKSCQPQPKEHESVKKESTFAPGSSPTPSEQEDELEEYDVDLPERDEDEIPSIIDCFDDDEPAIIQSGVLNKELSKLNKILSKEEPDENDRKEAEKVVEKIDRTDFFDKLVEDFNDGTGKKLLEGLRDKIKERELESIKETQSLASESETKTSTMSIKELEDYL